MDRLSIKDWPAEDKPRQKMLLKGREALSNAELIAILLGSGSKNESAVSLAKRILKDSEDLATLGKKSLDFLMSYKGIGEAKAISIAAALELGRRRQSLSTETRPKIRTSQDAFNILGPLLEDLPQEEFWIVCLNHSMRVLSKDRVSVGGVAGTVVDLKVIYTLALRQGASSIVLYHNHPSGQINPSEEDLRLTSKIKDAGAILDIKVQDHIIVGHGKYYSFLDDGLMA